MVMGPAHLFILSLITPSNNTVPLFVLTVLTMRFSTILAGLASLGFVYAGQAANPTGTVSVNPTTMTAGQFIDVAYDNTGAQNQPAFVDFYIQGEISPGKPTNYFMLSRNQFGAQDTMIHSNVSIPIVADTHATNWKVWAFATYLKNGRNELGMVSTPVTVN
ncbi:hypothetical protein VNI00_002308 [Paramarasmius palmivorus]|uniref:Uncharacterized protein n=1 Tax=Paramarasmius palmivorus TaxID=297713 RepID=A0AAW0E455_9AGAR